MVIGDDLPGLRDSPRPAWIAREGKPAILVTPGVDLASPSIEVRLVDPETGSGSVAATIERFSSAPIGALGAALVGGKLYVTWVDTTEGAATIRAAIVAEP